MENFQWLSPLMSIYFLSGALLSLLAVLLFRNRSRSAERRIIASILEAAAIPAYRHTLPQLNREISRVRRYQRPLSVIVFKPKDPAEDHPREGLGKNIAGDNGHEANPSRKLNQIEFLLCGRICQEATREVDIIAYDSANNQFIILLPESTKIQAVQTVKRLKNIIGKRITDQLSIGIAEFPADGVIIDDLVACAMPAANHRYIKHKTTDIDENINAK